MKDKTIEPVQEPLYKYTFDVYDYDPATGSNFNNITIKIIEGFQKADEAEKLARLQAVREHYDLIEIEEL